MFAQRRKRFEGRARAGHTEDALRGGGVDHTVVADHRFDDARQAFPRTERLDRTRQQQLSHTTAGPRPQRPGDGFKGQHRVVGQTVVSIHPQERPSVAVENMQTISQSAHGDVFVGQA